MAQRAHKGFSVRLLGALLALLFCLASVNAKDPEIKSTELKGSPADLQYFDDSETILLFDSRDSVILRSTDGGSSWEKVKKIGNAARIVMHLFDKKTAIVLGSEKTHWYTNDRGEEWREFETAYDPTYPEPPVSFHAESPEKVIINTRSSDKYVSVYTTDGFKSKPKTLLTETKNCIWAREQVAFDTDDKKLNADGTMCVVFGTHTDSADSQRLVISSDYFRDDRIEPKLDDGRTVSGIASMVAAKSFIVAAQQASGTSETALYVTKDSKKWHRAEFGHHQVREGGYTILESTNYSLQVDVLSSRYDKAMGFLFSSDSSGHYFTRNEDYTNRSPEGFVDYEKLQNVWGVALTNIVRNADDVLDVGAPKQLVSQICFDDGHTFLPLETDDGEPLHLHSFTDRQNAGRIFSSPAPGLVMGIGNTGKYLDEYKTGDLYISTDAGVSWRKSREGPHKYEFGDSGSIMLAIPDKEEVSKLSYSFDYGKEWDNFELDRLVQPLALTTIPDSTSTKFLLLALSGSGSSQKKWIYTMDFKNFDLKECKSGDFEDWSVQRPGKDDEDKKCIMGQTRTFRRRKAGANCFINEKTHEPVPDRIDTCPCQNGDYECEYGFMREDAKCVVSSSYMDSKCEKKDDTFKATPFRLIPGNQCEPDKKGSVDKPKEQDFKCGEAKAPAAPKGKISAEITRFESESFELYLYLERPATSNDKDETVIAFTSKGRLFQSNDHGKSWKQLLEREEITRIYQNPFFNEHIYFLTESSKIYYSQHRLTKPLKDFFEVPSSGKAGSVDLRFHPKNADWLIWTTCVERGVGCEAFSSRKLGDDWEKLLKSVLNCEYMYSDKRKDKEDLLYCVQSEDDATMSRQLLSTEDDFKHKKVLFDNMVNFATMSEYIVVARKDPDDLKYLTVESSIDGETFAKIEFPPKFQVDHGTAYTVLDSSTHRLFLHVTVNPNRDQEYGAIIKSNSNGTYFQMSQRAVNRNGAGYVDFEKMIGLEGVALVNVVDNVKEVDNGAKKKLKSMITHNDGTDWNYLTPPEKDIEGKSYKDCTDVSKCSLHLHGYTERKDPRDTLSSASAVGIMVGIGNVGEYLESKKEGDTFITHDGGASWKMARKGQYMWEYGDQGSIIVLVQDEVPTKEVYYSLDMGENWETYAFATEEMIITDITTVPSDTSRNFLLWGKEAQGRQKAVTVNVDFTGLTDRECKLDTEVLGKSGADFYAWTPFDLDRDENHRKCLFGHEAQYIRKKPANNDLCYVGRKLANGALHKIVKNCPCVRADFECDYNFERQADGTCKRVPGLPTRDPMDVCKDKSVKEYPLITGYRRLAMTTCEGGDLYDRTEGTKPCPGYQEEYRKKHGISGAGLFFAIFLPVAAACVVGWFVYRRYEGQFGQIRLGGDGLGASGVRTEQNWLRWPVAVVSGVAAVVLVVPAIIGTVFRAVRDRFSRGRATGALGSRANGYGRPYTSRSSFARGRAGYAAVHSDETDLLGEESDDDV